jgi:hypothetical protein
VEQALLKNQIMRNLVIVLILLIPFIGLSQQTSNEAKSPSSKIYYESGVEPFSNNYDKRQPTKIGKIITTVTVEDQSINHSEFDNDECRTTRKYEKQTAPLKTNVDKFFTIRVYENSKIYHEIKVPTNSQKRLYTIHHQDR